jgi:hypothetical protein
MGYSSPCDLLHFFTGNLLEIMSPSSNGFSNNGIFPGEREILVIRRKIWGGRMLPDHTFNRV